MIDKDERRDDNKDAGKILIVDDEPVNLRLLSEMLMIQGYSVRSVLSGSMALNSVHMDAPDVILLDIHMPEMDGYEVCQRLKSLEHARDIPIIFISALDDVADKVKAFTVGGVDYIIKPFQIEEVMARISTHLTVRSMHRQLREQNVRLQTEVSERKRAEDAFRRTEERYTRATAAAGVGVWDWNLETNDFFLDPHLKAMLGYKDDEIQNHITDWIRHVYPDDVSRLMHTNRAYLKGTLQVYDVEHRVYHKDGSIRWLSVRGSTIIRDEQGKPYRLSGIHLDITDRKKTEESLRMSEQMLTNVFASMGDAVFVIDANTVKILDCNPAASKIFGYTRDEMMGLTTSFLHTDVFAVEEFKNHLFSSVKQGAQVEVPTRDMKCKDGTIIVTEHSVMPLLDTQGNRIGWINVVRDITERKRAEEALRKAHMELEQRVQERTAELVRVNQTLRSEIEDRKRMQKNLQTNLRFLETLLATIPNPVFYKDISGTYLGCNQRFAEDILGLPPEEVYGRSLTDLARKIPKDLSPVYQEHDEHLFQTQGIHMYESPVQCADGTTRDFIFYKATFTNAFGEIEGIVGVMSDITERVRHDREREAIVTMAAALRAATNRTEMIDILLVQVGKLIDASGGILMMYDSSHSDVVLKQGGGAWKTTTDVQANIDAHISMHVVTTGQAFLSNDVSNDSVIKAVGTRDDVSAMAHIPLIADEQIIGTLGVGCQHSISNEDMRILNAISDMAANALHRMSLHEQTSRRLDHIQALHTIDQTITTSLNLRVTLNVLIYQVTSQLGVDAACVLLFNADTHHLEYASGHGFRTAAIRQSSLRLGEGFAGRTAMGQEFFQVPDIDEEQIICVRSAMVKQEGFVVYYGVPLIARGRIKGVLELYHRSKISPDQEWLGFLGTLAGQASIAIDNADLFEQLQRSNMDLSRAYDATIEGWARALELRDTETEGHCRRVTDLTVRLARAMEFSDEDIVHIRRGAILHDIGKMAIPDSILFKKGPLTHEEHVTMQQHTIHAYKLLSPIPFLRSALDIPYCHHEKWDGTGYPRGLKGEEIPLAARMFAVVDVWDALCFDRPYRKGWEKSRVSSYIQEQSGTHFDPYVVDTFLNMMHSRA